MQAILAAAEARVSQDSRKTPVQQWLEKTVTAASTARVTSDDLSALKVWAHSHSWNYVEDIVDSISSGLGLKYPDFLDSMNHLKAAHKTAILSSLRQANLPSNFYETAKEAVMKKGGNNVDALYRLSQITFARLQFMDAWQMEPHDSFFSVFVSPWLELTDVVRIDSAVPHSLRSTWTTILKTLQSPGIDEHQHNSKSLMWVRTRCSHITKLLTDEASRSSIKDNVFTDLPGAHALPAAETLFPELKKAELGAENASHCSLTKEGLSAFVKGSPKIESLALMQCDVTDSGMRNFAKHCPCLTYLSVRYCGKVTDVGVLALVQGCPNLSDLDLSWCNKLSDVGCKTIGQHCTVNLVKLDLSLCTLLTDVGIKALVAGLPRLQHLSLYACKLITDASCRAIATGCPGLDTLKLSLCEKLTNEGVAAVAKGCPSLTHLNLSLCEKVTDLGVLEVATHCRKLKLFNLYGDKLITNASVQHLADKCPDIENLNLYRCELISDDGMLAMARLPKLKHVNLWNCPKISTVGFKAVVKGCGSLLSLDVRNCELVSPGALHEAKRLRPNLELEGGER